MCVCLNTRKLKATAHHESVCSTQKLKMKNNPSSAILPWSREKLFDLLFCCYSLEGILEMNSEFKKNCGNDLSFKPLMDIQSFHMAPN